MSSNPSIDRPVNVPGPANRRAPGFAGLHADPEALALYALQLLPSDPSFSLARHLEHCSECRRELTLTLGDLAAYAFSVEPHSPSALARQRLRTQVARESPPAPAAQPAFATFGRNGSILAPVEDELPRRHRMLTIFGWLGWIVAAGVAVTAASLYQQTIGQRNHLSVQSIQIASLNNEAAREHQIMDALAGPNAERVSLTAKPPVNPQPHGQALYNPVNGSLLFLADDLDPLQADKAYEIWLIPADGSTPIPASLFHSDSHGDASVILPTLPKGVPAKGFGVTIEDLGGAPTPTLPFILAGGSIAGS